MIDSDKSELVIHPPSLMKSLTAGFDAISNHAWIVIFTCMLDCILWLGPKLRFYTLVQNLLLQSSALATTSNSELIENVREMLMSFNLMSSLRTFPVGIPSLMVNRAPLQSPAGVPASFDVNTPGLVILTWVLLNVLGICFGAIYFSLVSQISTTGKVSWRQTASEFPNSAFQVFLLSLAFVIGLFLFGLPFSCLISVALLSGLGVANFTGIIALIAGGLLIWLLLPLFFSPHGIFVYKYRFWQSIRNSVRVARMTLPTTSLLILVVVVISEGMSIIWSIPEETSWLSLVGILGHGFVSTSLLASTFIYFQDANKWVKDMVDKTRLSVA